MLLVRLGLTSFSLHGGVQAFGNCVMISDTLLALAAWLEPFVIFAFDRTTTADAD